MGKDEMMERYKARIKRQNEKIKEDYDRISVTLPKGTKERIEAQGYSFNNLAKQAILSFLEMLEEDQEEIETDTPDEPMHPARIQEEEPKKAEKQALSLEDGNRDAIPVIINKNKAEAALIKDNEALKQRQKEIEKRNEEKRKEAEKKEAEYKERMEEYAKEMKEYHEKYGVSGQWITSGGH